MSINTGNFQEATYKGVSLGRVITQTAPLLKKIKVHEFPNRDRAYVEELGLKGLSISITGEVYVPRNDNAINELIKITTQEGVGDLVIGRQKYTKMICEGITPDVNLISEVGKWNYSLTFYQTEPTITSTNNDVNKGFIRRLKDRVFTQNVQALINKKAELTKKYPNIAKNITATKDAMFIIPNIGNEMLRRAKTVQGSATGFSDFTSTLNVFNVNAGILAGSPSILADSLNSSLFSLETAFDGALELFGVSREMTAFQVSNDAYYIDSTTKEIIDTNRNIINDNVKTTSLALCYFASVNIDYQSVNNLQENREFLEQTFQSLDAERLDEDLYQTLIELRTVANKTLDLITLQLPKIQSYNITQRPLAKFVYGLYGNLDNIDLIDNINNTKDVSSLSGGVLALV